MLRKRGIISAACTFLCFSLMKVVVLRGHPIIGCLLILAVIAYALHASRKSDNKL
jgi:mannose/fructose/N-acetylgalactosamine-specific phosphotransferase system component IID